MNIFVLNECPIESANEMCDKHVIKMPTESLQMISTCLDYYGFESPYRPVMLNHPCTMWARRSRQNMQWLVDHAYALCHTYTERYGKVHKVETTLDKYADEIAKLLDFLTDKGLTPFALAMPDEYKDYDSVTKSYQDYYLGDKWYFAEWRLGKPDWYPANHMSNKRKELEERRIKHVMDRKV
jgi:hypothetical protein